MKLAFDTSNRKKNKSYTSTQCCGKNTQTIDQKASAPSKGGQFVSKQKTFTKRINS